MKKKILICIMLISFCFNVFPCSTQAIANANSNGVLTSNDSSLVLASNKTEVKITAKDDSSVNLSEELLKNTGFEEDYTATGEWISYASGQFERTMETAHSGKYSVKVYDRDAYWNGVAQDITDILKKNGQGKYKYSAWVKTENLDQTMVLGLILYDDAEARHGYSVRVDAAKDNWVYISGEADVTWTGELSNSILLLEGGEGQTLTNFYVDDVSLKKIVENPTDTPTSNESEAGPDELSEELMKNTGFEEDYTATGEWVSYASGQFERTKEAAHSGEWGAKVYDRDAYWNGISQDITEAFKEKGQGKYVFSVWAKTEKLDQKIVVYIFCWNTDKKRYVYSAEGAATKDGWTQVSGKADIKWEGELDETILLVVTGEEKEAASFYVDDFSLKKIGGASVNPSKGTQDDQPAVIPELPKDQKKVYPKESLEFLNTPYKGYYVYGEGDPFQWVPESVWNYVNVGYLRTNWKDLEPEEGQYNWKFIEECIDECKKHNAALAIAFMPVNVSSDTWGVQSTPEWVFKAGAKYTVQKIKRPGEIIDVKVPVWDDPIYMEKLQKFITALKKKYDDRPEIAHFDLRNYGNWGEWHLGRLTGSQEISLDAKKKHIDMWKGFKKPVLMVSNSSTSSMEKEVRYALNQYNFGVRRDGCMHPFASSNHKVLANCYDIAPSAMEWWGDYSSWGPNGEFKDQAGILPILFERTVTEGKISFVPLSKWESEAWCEEQKRLVDYWYNRIGYWLKFTEISYPSNICAGAITLRAKNDGVAPIYPNHQNIGYVKVAILDNKNNVLDSKTLEGINPYLWKPGVYKEEYATYDFGTNKKAKKLAIGVFTDEALEMPDVQLGIQAERVGNWYILNSMPKKEDKVVSANKLYDASKEYADSGYGFRWAEYAFDNDEKTFWSTGASNEDSWLQIDFGCEKTVSEVYLKEASTNAKGFKIQCYDGSKWVDVKSGTSIGTKGKTLSFTPRKARLLRIYFNAVAKGIQISECKVYSKADKITAMSDNEEINVYLIGDSLCQKYSSDFYPQQGWGNYLQQYFKDNVVIKNKAVGGFSTKTYLFGSPTLTDKGLPVWPDIKALLKKGDFVIVSLGHNDRETTESTTETAYKENLHRFVTETREMGAEIVFITSPPEAHDNNGSYINPLKNRSECMKAQAAADNVVCLDLNQTLFDAFSAMPLQQVRDKYFLSNLVQQGIITQEQADKHPRSVIREGKNDYIHLQENGAKFVCEKIVDLIKNSESNLKYYII